MNIAIRIWNALYSRFLSKKIAECRTVHFQYPVDLVGGGGNIVIGKRTYFSNHLTLNAWNTYQGQQLCPIIRIGSGCSFQPYNHISCINRIEIGDHVLTGRWVTICDNNHGDTSIEQVEMPPRKRKMTSNGPIIIGDNVWIGDKVTVLGGVTIGNNSIIGANSVVTKDIPPYTVAAGIPAKVIKVIKEQK